MPLTAFVDRFPEVAAHETLVLHIEDADLPVPPGIYGFTEWYCNEAGCDCRRVMFQVISPQHPGEILASINYGWENEKFYRDKLPYAKNAGREITSGSLDPINPNSKLAGALLDAFRNYVHDAESYRQQLKRHYEQFKGK